MSEFRKVFPPSGKIQLDGGLNTKFEKSIIENNESPDCLNVVFGTGSVGTRDGFIKVNTTSVGTYVCDGLYTRRGSGNAETMCAFFNGTMYTLDGASTFVTVPSAQSVFTAGVRIGTSQMENHLFVGNGGVTPYKYNGTNFTRHGVPLATNTISMNSNGAGSPNGDYRYKVLYRNSALVAGDASTSTATFTVVNSKILLTSLPVAPQSHGVNSRRIYRTVAGGSSYLLVTTISDNTTTSYDDNIADSALGAAAPTDQGEPPKYSTIIYHQNRLFMNDSVNEGLVWYTDLNEPYTVKTTNFLTIGDQSTDFVKAIAVYNDALVVFGQKAVWFVYMTSTDPTTWKIVKSRSPFSTNSPHGIFEFNNKLAFPAVQSGKFVGYAALTGEAIAPDATQTTISTIGSLLKSERIEPDMFDVQESYAGNISALVFKNRAYISLTKATPNTTNNRIYVMDFSIENLSKDHKEAWVPWTGLQAAQFTVYSGGLYFGSANAVGSVYKQNVGVYADDSTAIDSYFWTKEFTGQPGDDSWNKDFRFMNMLIDQPGAYFMNLVVRTDSDPGSGNSYQVDVSPDGSFWGTMIWGTDTWGAGALQRDRKIPLAGARGKRVQFKFSNQNKISQRFKVHWLNFTYNTKGPR